MCMLTSLQQVTGQEEFASSFSVLVLVQEPFLVGIVCCFVGEINEQPYSDFPYLDWKCKFIDMHDISDILLNSILKLRQCTFFY